MLVVLHGSIQNVEALHGASWIVDTWISSTYVTTSSGRNGSLQERGLVGIPDPIFNSAEETAFIKSSFYE